jgi:hypothetical protein
MRSKVLLWASLRSESLTCLALSNRRLEIVRLEAYDANGMLSKINTQLLGRGNGRQNRSKAHVRSHSLHYTRAERSVHDLFSAGLTNSRRAARRVLAFFPFFYNPKKPKKLPGRAAFEFSEIYEKRE